MSDILIRGIEKPKSCRACPFRQETYLLTRQICIANHNEELCTGIDKIDESCPISQVQKHGDLIDRDALRAEFPEPNEENGGWRNPDEALVHKTGVWAAIDAAPTIIPASE